MSVQVVREIDFERSKQIAERVANARRLSPYRALSVDMTHDYFQNILGKNRRLDKRINKFGSSIIDRVASEMTPPGPLSFPAEANVQLGIFDEIIEAETTRVVEDFANTNAIRASYELRYAGHIQLGSDFSYKDNLVHSDEKISMDRFGRLWAEDYAQRFGQAVVLENAGIDLAEITGRAEAIQQ